MHAAQGFGRVPAQDQLRKQADETAARVPVHEQCIRQGRVLCQHHRAVTDRRRAVPACVQTAPLDQLRPGRPAGLDCPRRTRRARSRSDAQGYRLVRRLRLPVHDRGTRSRRPVQAAVPAYRGQQCVSGFHPPVPARLRNGLLRAARLRQRQLARSARLRRGPHQGRRRPRLQGDPRLEAGRNRSRHRAGEQVDGGVKVPVVIEIMLERITNISMGHSRSTRSWSSRNWRSAAKMRRRRWGCSIDMPEVWGRIRCSTHQFRLRPPLHNSKISRRK